MQATLLLIARRVDLYGTTAAMEAKLTLMTECQEDPGLPPGLGTPEYSVKTENSNQRT